MENTPNKHNYLTLTVVLATLLFGVFLVGTRSLSTRSDMYGSQQLAQVIATFGNQSGNQAGSSSRPICSAAVAPESGAITSIQALVSGTGGAMSAAVYSSNAQNTAPSTLLASQTTSLPVVPSSVTWLTVPISSSITSGTTYWLCIWGSQSLTYEYLIDATRVVALGSQLSSDFSQWPATFSVNTSSTGRYAAIYASYTPGASASGGDTGGTSSTGDSGSGSTSGSQTTPSSPPTSTPPSTTNTNGYWYVDVNAVGVATGLSWTDAWTSFGAIDWTKIKPGNTIWVSGGVYNEGIAIKADGVRGNPIIIKSSQEAGHAGVITLAGGISLNGHNWITVDGAKSDSYTSVIGDDTTKVPMIKNNINFITHNINMGSGSPIEGLTFKWLDISTSLDAENYGIRFNPSSPYFLGSIEIAYDWIHDVGQDAIAILSNSNVAWDAVVIHHNLIERAGDDGFEIGPGNTIHHNILGGSVALRGHPDGIQFTGSYQRIYNNIFTGWWLNSYIRGQGYEEEYKNIQIYGNFFSPKGAKPPNNPIELVWYGNQASWNTRDTSYWKDWVIANNTFADIATSNAFTISKTRSWLKNAYFQNMLIKNNAFIDIGVQGSVFGIAGGNIDPTDVDHCCIYTTEAGTMVDYNVITRSNKIMFNPLLGSSGGSGTGSLSFSYNGLAYATAETFDNATRYKHNTSALPMVTDMASYDYRPTGADTVMRDKGVDLSYLGLPGINKDLYGNYRGNNGVWDIGAFEYMGSSVTPNTTQVDKPVFRLFFDGDDFSTLQNDLYKTMRFADTGGSSVIDCQSAFSKNGTIFNQCPSRTIGPDGSKAAQFSGGAICDMNADYLAVNNTGQLTGLTRGSVAFWLADGDNTAITQRILDTFTLYTSQNPTPGTWQVHRDGDIYLTLTANSTAGLETDIMTFPGGSAPVGSWHHYAFTWNGSTVKGYYDGVYFGEAPMPYSSFNIGTYLAIGALKHNEPRNSDASGNCVNQYGSPAGQYVFPNAGFYGGKIDDVRIYNSELSATDVSTIFNTAALTTGEHILSVSKFGNGDGAVSGTGIGCGKHCAESYPSSSQITLTAIPSYGSVFAGWSGACSGTVTCSLAMSANRYVTASFTSTLYPIAGFDASSGSIAYPFVVQSGIVSQNTNSTDPLTGGRAAYTFNVAQTGDYVVSVLAGASSQASNSFFVNIDTEPTVDNVWHMTTTAGFENRFVSWGGSTSGGNSVHTFHLLAGSHTLIIRGREAGTAIKLISILSQNGTIVPPTTPASLSADFNSDGHVNSLDFSLLQGSWNRSSTIYDLNKDGIVNSLDYSILIQQWTG